MKTTVLFVIAMLLTVSSSFAWDGGLIVVHDGKKLPNVYYVRGNTALENASIDQKKMIEYYNRTIRQANALQIEYEMKAEEARQAQLYALIKVVQDKDNRDMAKQTELEARLRRLEHEAARPRFAVQMQTGAAALGKP